MKKIFTLILLAACISFTASVSAQKIAFVNSSILLQDLPEVKKAESEIQVLGTQLQKAFENDVTKWQTKLTELQRKEKSGDISPKMLQDEAKSLEEEQQRLGQRQQEMQKQLQDKEAELLKPILDKVNEIIKTVATENGYQAVFDATPALLYVDPAIDITEMVKAKL